MPILIDLGTAMALYHGALTVGLTSYPAAEARFTVVHEQVPNVQVEAILVAPIGRSEPVSLQGAARLTLWRF